MGVKGTRSKQIQGTINFINRKEGIKAKSLRDHVNEYPLPPRSGSLVDVKVIAKS